MLYNLRRKCTAILLKKRFCSRLPTLYNVATQEKLQLLVFNIVCEVGGRGGGGGGLGGWNCIRVWCVPRSAESANVTDPRLLSMILDFLRCLFSIR